MRLKIHFITLLGIITCTIFTAAVLMNDAYAQAEKEEKKEAKKEEAAKDAKEAPREEITGWRVKDFKPYIQAMRDLEKLSKEYSENLLKLAIDEYSTGLDILEDMESEVNKTTQSFKERKNLNERWYWQEIDRKNQEMRIIARIRHEAKIKAVTFFTRAINHLDAITFVEVRRDPKFTNFQTRLFQVYVSCQYDTFNLKPCIPILERYIAMNDQNKKDVWAYKYLASCYGYMETTVTKYRQASEDVQLQYKSMKNRYMLQAIELQYGVESPEYKHLQEIVEQDEKKSERLNDFR